MSKETEEHNSHSSKVFVFFNYRKIIADLRIQLQALLSEYRLYCCLDELPPQLKNLCDRITQGSNASEDTDKAKKKLVFIDSRKTISLLQDHIKIFTSERNRQIRLANDLNRFEAKLENLPRISNKCSYSYSDPEKEYDRIRTEIEEFKYSKWIIEKLLYDEKYSPSSIYECTRSLTATDMLLIASEWLKDKEFDALRCIDLALRTDPNILDKAEEINFPVIRSLEITKPSYLAIPELPEKYESSSVYHKHVNSDSVTETIFLDEPLDVAAWLGCQYLVKWFLHNNRRFDLKTKNVSIALLIAAENGDVNTFNCLLEGGADIQHEDKKGRTALTIASISGHLSIVKRIVEFCLEKQINLAIDHCDATDNATSLMYASMNGHIMVVEYLIENGASCNRVSQSRMTPIDFAVIGGHQGIIDLLLKHNVDKFWFSRRLCIVAGKGQIGIMKSLIKLGADCSFFDDLTPLMGACLGGYITAVRFLIKECSVDVNQTRTDGWTALMFASLSAKDKSALDIEKDSERKYPINYEKRQRETISLLLSHGATITHDQRNLLNSDALVLIDEELSRRSKNKNEEKFVSKEELAILLTSKNESKVSNPTPNLFQSNDKKVNTLNHIFFSGFIFDAARDAINILSTNPKQKLSMPPPGPAPIFCKVSDIKFMLWVMVEQEAFQASNDICLKSGGSAIFYYNLSSFSNSEFSFEITKRFIQRCRDHDIEHLHLIGFAHTNEISVEALKIFEKFRDEEGLQKNTLIFDYTEAGKEKFRGYIQSMLPKNEETPLEVEDTTEEPEKRKCLIQ